MSALPESVDLAPIQAVLHPAYPERLREIAEFLFLVLVGEEETAPDAERSARLAQIAFAQCERLSAELGGSGFYMHKAISYRLTARNRQMCSEFRGDYRVLARKWKLTEQQVRNIVDEWQKEEFSRRQGDIFGAAPSAHKHGR
ncbi:MAG: Mor transcription activator family protein [Polaromonas sp.]